MKKTISNIRTMAALLMAGAAFAACSNSDDIINEQPVNPVKQGYTLTVSASKDGSTTRALDLDGSAVVASWETTDEIVVTKADGTEVGTLSPTSISGLEATFTGTVDGEFAANDVLTLSYHPIASIEGFASQNGTLNGSAASAENFDMAVATVTISEITGNKIIVSESSAYFANQTAVVVLTPHASYQDPGGTAGISSLVVSVMMDIPEVGTVTEEIGPITISGDLPYYFSLPSQSLLADFLAAKYSLTASEISTLLASATITFTGQQYGVYYLTCDKTGYKFAAGKYYKLDENNFVMTEVLKRSAAGKDVYVENQDGSWSNTVTFAVNRGIGWRVDGDYVFWGDKQLYVEISMPEPSEGWVKASDNIWPFGATYSLRDPEPAAKAAAEATAEDLGKVIGADGNIYDDVAAATAAGTTARAIIAYVGDGDTSDDTYNHGLAIAMSDANGGSKCAWYTRTQAMSCVSGNGAIATAIGYKDGIGNTNTLTTDGHTHAAATAAASNNGTAAPTGTSGWFLPSIGQWNLIVQGLASKKAGSAVTTNISGDENSTYTSSNLNSVITAAGGTGFESDDYHSSTLSSPASYFWVMQFGEGGVRDWGLGTTNYVRSVLAF